ncbi:MAG TPA: sigma-70 family RNA polymerase sigma factor [bacterium]|nr:sigma-70 family RNA polymerase sigma factor [bacterium]
MTAYIPALSNDSLSAYIHSALAVPDLGRDEEEDLFRRYRIEGDIDAARRIILSSLKLVVHAAYKFRKFRDVVDLIQEGNVGLVTALKKFDLAKGVRFATYALWWIKAKIQEFILSHMSIVRYGKGRDERKLFFNLVSTVREIEAHDQGRELTREELIAEVARRLGMDPIRVADNMRVLTSICVALSGTTLASTANGLACRGSSLAAAAAPSAPGDSARAAGPAVHTTGIVPTMLPFCTLSVSPFLAP